MELPRVAQRTNFCLGLCEMTSGANGQKMTKFHRGKARPFLGPTGHMVSIQPNHYGGFPLLKPKWIRQLSDINLGKSHLELSENYLRA